MRVGHVLDHVGEQDPRPQLVLLVGAEPVQDGLAGPAYVVQVPAVHLEHAELPLDDKMPGSTAGTARSARSVTRSIASAGATSTMSACCPANGG